MWPKIILGGMGVAVSWWYLVRLACLATSKLGLDFLGIVSLTAIGDVAIRRLQLGDKDMLRALHAFPVSEVAAIICEKYYIEGGKRSKDSFHQLPLFSLDPSWDLIWINIFAGFAEVWLAREGHEGKVGVNILEKIQMPIIYNLLGAMWAGADAVIVGAGLPIQIPEVINAILEGREIFYRLTVAGDCRGQEFVMQLDLEKLLQRVSAKSRHNVNSLRLDRPWFFPIVTLSGTAKILEDKIGEEITGFVVEEKDAGGHNAPPRNKKADRNQFGELVYGPKDVIDWTYFAELSKRKPFFPAAGFISRAKRKEYAQYNPAGFQIGGPFGACNGTGIHQPILLVLRNLLMKGQLEVLSNPDISSSGYPFQTASLYGTLAEVGIRENRKKRCNLGYLRQAYCENGELKFRCSAEEPSVYVAKGGKLDDTVNKGCLCNGLMSNIGLAQVYKDGYREPSVVTYSKTGHDVLRRLLIENRGQLPVSELLVELAG